MSVRERHEASYFFTFIYDYNRHSHVYLISHKTKAFECFRQFMNLVENQLNFRIKVFKNIVGVSIFKINLRIYLMNKEY